MRLFLVWWCAIGFVGLFSIGLVLPNGRVNVFVGAYRCIGYSFIGPLGLAPWLVYLVTPEHFREVARHNAQDIVESPLTRAERVRNFILPTIFIIILVALFIDLK